MMFRLLKRAETQNYLILLLVSSLYTYRTLGPSRGACMMEKNKNRADSKTWLPVFNYHCLPVQYLLYAFNSQNQDTLKVDFLSRIVRVTKQKIAVKFFRRYYISSKMHIIYKRCFLLNQCNLNKLLYSEQILNSILNYNTMI